MFSTKNGVKGLVLPDLTPKQARFVEEYLIDCNASAAAVRAGYSPRTARRIGWENLQKPDIQAALSERQAVLQDRYAVTQDRVIRELALIAFADMRHYAEWDRGGVTLKACEDLSEEQSRVVQEVSHSVTKDGSNVRFKLHSKVEALEKLGRHLGLWKEGINLDGPIEVKVVGYADQPPA